jgi:hypothetical protein
MADQQNTYENTSASDQIAEQQQNADEPQRHVDAAGTSPAHDIRHAESKKNNNQSDELNGGPSEDSQQQQADQNENGERFAVYQPTSYQLGADDQEPIGTENEDSDA